MHKDIKKILLSADEIKKIVSELAEKINADFKGQPTVAIVLLKGSMFFAADLMRELTMPVSLDFMKLSSYGNETNSSGIVKILLDTSVELEGKNLLIIEDIVDSGRTLLKVQNMLKDRSPKCVRICTLLDKPDRREADVYVDYVGSVIPNEFVVGYGLDYAEQYRNLPYIGILDESVYSN